MQNRIFCVTLAETNRYYSRFSDHLKENRKSGMDPDSAIRETLDYCKKNRIMEDYLPHKTKEVFRMLNYAWNEEEAREALTEYGIELGIRQGMERGIQQSMEDTAKSMLQDNLYIMERHA